MSFAGLFNSGARRRTVRAKAAQRAVQRPAAGQPTDEEHIGARLNRYAARATKGLESEFIPEELGSLFIPRTVSYEEAEGSSRPSQGS